MDTITPLELEAMLADRIDVVLVNVMSERAFEREHIPSSHNLSVVDESFAERVEQLAGSKHDTIVVYGAGDESADESEGAARKLAAAGFTDVMHLEDGLEGWIDSGLGVESGEV
jgi:rhodanese-related sulfurtransferase